MTGFESLKFYMIRNSEGLYFRAKGYGGSGDSWVADPHKARVYGKPGPARSQITYFRTHFPLYPTPDLLEIGVGTVTVLDEKGRVEAAARKIRDAEARREARNRKHDLERARIEFEKAEQRLRNLGG